MARRALPALLALVALIADLAGVHGFALLVLLAAIPAAFVLVLDTYGDAIATRCGAGRPCLAVAGLALLVLSAALRSPAVVGGVPRIAISAVGVSILLYAVQAATLRRPRARTVEVVTEDVVSPDNARYADAA